jgi:hypothetical protein
MGNIFGSSWWDSATVSTQTRVVNVLGEGKIPPNTPPNIKSAIKSLSIKQRKSLSDILGDSIGKPFSHKLEKSISKSFSPELEKSIPETNIFKLFRESRKNTSKIPNWKENRIYDLEESIMKTGNNIYRLKQSKNIPPFQLKEKIAYAERKLHTAIDNLENLRRQQHQGGNRTRKRYSH